MNSLGQVCDAVQVVNCGVSRQSGHQQLALEELSSQSSLLLKGGAGLQPRVWGWVGKWRWRQWQSVLLS